MQGASGQGQHRCKMPPAPNPSAQTMTKSSSTVTKSGSTMTKLASNQSGRSTASVVSGPQAKILEVVDEARGNTSSFGPDSTFYFIRLVKGKGESLVEIKSPEYTVELDRTTGDKLGLKIEVQQSAGCIFVRDVVGGLAEAWNSRHKSTMIKKGDRIVKVNDVVGTSKRAQMLQDECKMKKKLVMTVRCGSARKIKPGLRVSVKTAFGQLRVGREGIVEKVDDDGDALIKFKTTGAPFSGGLQWVAKENFDMFTIDDSECFIFRRFEDFKELYRSLQKKHERRELPDKFGQGKWPELPRDENFGFRRTMSNLGVSGWRKRRQDGLQEVLNWVLRGLDTLDQEPLIASFFSQEAVPAVSSSSAHDLLKQKLESLVEKYRHMASVSRIVEEGDETES